MKTEQRKILQRVRVERVTPLIEGWLRSQGRPDLGFRNGDLVGSLQWLAREAQISDRTLRRLRGMERASERSNGTGEWVTFATLERVLIALDRTELLYLDPEDGGFSDVY